MNMMFFNMKQQPVNYSRNYNPNYSIARTPQQSLIQYTQPEEPKKKEMLWGAPTWFLLHTLAEKVKDDSFNSIRNDLFEMIRTICSNLPCPKCSNHAIEYMKYINFNSITNKRELQLFLFQFHNDVNKRKSVPLFEKDELSEKYSKANTINIIHNFFHFFKDRSRNVNMISLNLYRERIIKDLRLWFQQNIQHFET